MATTPSRDKLPPGPQYDPVTSWTEIALWLAGVLALVTVATLALIYLT